MYIGLCYRAGPVFDVLQERWHERGDAQHIKENLGSMEDDNTQQAVKGVVANGLYQIDCFACESSALKHSRLLP
jgi:hypothetical protein